MKPILTILIILICSLSAAAQNLDALEAASTPSITQNLHNDTIPPPWDQLDLTGIRMKPYFAATVNEPVFPWLPVGGGIIVGGGLLTFLLTDDNTEPTPDCTFETTVTSSPAHCGDQDGQATLTVAPVGEYIFSWDNGGTSAQESLGAGTHSVTITSPGGFCTEVLTITIEELPPLFDATFDTEASNCGLDNGSITATVTPDGVYEALWSNGASGLTISNLPPGEYAVTLTNDAGCSNSFSTSVEIGPNLEIVLEVVFPPSSPSADDGGATIVVTMPGPEPYIIFLDGEVVAVATGTTITIEGMTAGEHTIQISAENGCLSNILNVFIPFSSFNFQLGTIVTLSHFASIMTSENREVPPIFTEMYALRQGISLSSSYLIANSKQYSRLTIFPAHDVSGGTNHFPSVVRIEQMARLIRSKQKLVELSLNAGLSVDFFPGLARSQTYWQANTQVSKMIFQDMELELSASLRGGGQADWPVWSFGIFMAKK